MQKNRIQARVEFILNHIGSYLTLKNSSLEAGEGAHGLEHQVLF